MARVLKSLIPISEFDLLREQAVKEGLSPTSFANSTQITGSYGDRYTLAQTCAGGKYFVDAHDRPMSEAFNPGDDTEYFAFDSDGNRRDEVYIKSSADSANPMMFRPACDNSNRWREITEVSIPYDIDVFWGSSCNGTDWIFFHPDPLLLKGGGEFIKIMYDDDSSVAIMTGELIEISNGKPARLQTLTSHDPERDRDAEILMCGYSSAQDRSDRQRLRSALFLLRDEKQRSLFPAKGPYVLRPIHIDTKYSNKRVRVDSVDPTRDGEGVVRVTIDVGLFGEAVMNRRGEIFKSLGRGGLKFSHFSEKQTRIVGGALMLERAKNPANAAAIDPILAALARYKPGVKPAWLTAGEKDEPAFKDASGLGR